MVLRSSGVFTSGEFSIFRQVSVQNRNQSKQQTISVWFSFLHSNLMIRFIYLHLLILFMIQFYMKFKL